MSQSSGSSGLQKQAMDTASKSMPWRKDLPWWVVLIQAIILTLLGLFVLTNPSSAGAIVILAAGVMLLIDGIMAVIGSLRGRHKARANTLNAVNAGIAIIFGVLVLLGVFDVLQFGGSTTAVLAGLGLLVTGAISLFIALFMRHGERIRWLRVIGPLVWIAFGILVFVTLSDANSFNPLPIVGWAALLLGIILFVLTYFRFKASKAEEAAATAAAAPAATTPAATATAPAPAPKPAAPAPAAAAPAPAPKPAEPPPAAPAPEPPANSAPPASEEPPSANPS